MSVDYPKMVPWFDAMANGAMQIAAFIPEAGRPVVAAIAVALRFASDLAKQGINPAEHIERIHAADTALQSVEGVWATRIRAKFEQG